ncbi:MAG: hypothetical protein Q8N90_00135 [bacterium]|nr:hypothetical protein [bacterium]
MSQRDISLSSSESNFDPAQYLPALSFYANKSTLLYLLNKLWDPMPFFPGFSVVFFYLYAFSSYISNLRDKILLAVMVGAYIIPGLIAVVFFQRQAFTRINSIAEIGLVILFLSTAFFVFFVRKKIPFYLKLISLLFMVLIFISFNPFPKIFDVFNTLAGFFPFLHRSRGLRTLYILPLLIIGLFAFGLKAFLEKKRDKKIYLWAIVLILLLEHFRWPVAMAKLPEIDSDAKKIYQMADPYPHHYGILELPFLPGSSNTYSFLTRFHNKHTYHGRYLSYDDPMNINGEDGLRLESELSGLADPEIIKKLKENGLNLIVISGSFITQAYDGDLSAIWQKVRKNIQRGQTLGLFKEIKELPNSLLIILDDRQQGQDVKYQIPYFALVGKKSIQFKLEANQPTFSQIYFNDRLIAEKEYPEGEYDISLDFRTVPKKNQINQLQLLNSKPVIVQNLQIK